MFRVVCFIDDDATPVSHPESVTKFFTSKEIFDQSAQKAARLLKRTSSYSRVCIWRSQSTLSAGRTATQFISSELRMVKGSLKCKTKR